MAAAAGAEMSERMAQEQSPDAKGLEQLLKAGSDLAKLHRFEFTLRFGTKFSAERAAGELLGVAFESKVERGKSDSEWLIAAVVSSLMSQPVP
jgi:hypothetical protein